MELITSSDFQKYVFHALECPMCLEIATPPVTLCQLGHFICGICRKKLDRCVICRNEYTGLRCYTVENIASQICVRCRNKPCVNIQTIPRLADHMEKCEYRPVICNNNSRTVCVNKPIAFDKFVDHLREDHEAFSATGLSDILASVWTKKRIYEGRKGRVTWRNRLYAYDDVTFILNIALDDAVLYFWISAMLSESQASKYSADIHIGQKDKLEVGKINCDERNIKWTVGVVSARVTLNDMKDSRDCVAFPATRMISVSMTNTDEVESFSAHVELKLRKL